jgi:predicted nucleic acid-binding protein
MIVYLDTSVIVSRLLNQDNRLPRWGEWQKAWSSLLTRMEFFRTMDRLRMEQKIDDDERVALYQKFGCLWEALYRYPITERIQQRVTEPFPTILGTLDAIHLVTALEAARIETEPIVLLTHDSQLSKAAMSVGFTVEGV